MNVLRAMGRAPRVTIWDIAVRQCLSAILRFFAGVEPESRKRIRKRQAPSYVSL